MISILFYVIGVILVILGVAAFLGVHLVSTPAGVLIVVGLISLVIAYVVSRRATL